MELFFVKYFAKESPCEYPWWRPARQSGAANRKEGSRPRRPQETAARRRPRRRSSPLHEYLKIFMLYGREKEVALERRLFNTRNVAVWFIRISWNFWHAYIIFPNVADPRMFISDRSSNNSKKRGREKIWCPIFFCSLKFYKNEKYFIFRQVNCFANSPRIIALFTQ